MLEEADTSFDLEADVDMIEDALEEVREDLGDWQDVLYTHGKYAVLVCLQGMDTAGKDSLIREVFKDFIISQKTNSVTGYFAAWKRKIRTGSSRRVI